MSKNIYTMRVLLMLKMYIFLGFMLLMASVHAQNRYALVIGNGDYPQRRDFINDAPPLPNPANDARDVAKLLKGFGFTLVNQQGKNRPLINATKMQMDNAVDQLLARLHQHPDSEVIFYYSGHGVYVQDLNRPQESANYLLPVGVNFPKEDPAKFKGHGVNAHNIKDRLEAASTRTRLMILDACRDKFILKKSKGFSGGGEFRPMNPINGMMVVHATLHSYRAWSDDKRRNSDFTRHLLPALRGGANTHLMQAIGNAVQQMEQQNQGLPAVYQQHPVVEGMLFGQVCLGSCGQVREKIQAEPVAGEIFQDKLRNAQQGPQMVSIPAGHFRMGDIQGGGSDDEQPVHPVSVAAFAMSRYEITLEEFQAFVTATNYQGIKPKYEWGCQDFMQANFQQSTKHPVVCVTWLDAVAYTQWLSRETGNSYRLPTETQWEYAARAGSESKYWWGNAIGKNKANCNGCGSTWDGKQTAPVGSFSANAFGLFDTVGNVWEWTCSVYEKKYQGQEQTCLLNKKDNERRVLRGGSWNSKPDWVRSAYRSGGGPSERSLDVGFRVARIY
ncbi:SUMF1/EgtB/PvdO family nonheme iron enzyme [Candidatus Venteria ishoeyi]|uniref:SUMF1/EgtB/PvdO family nonheme iron enzyme n=1 Tax=Candidatus Venteria ishoeyi TaxID=1899563 RepID=UPI0025A566B4|nr:SUMF1/EgtB/PvdO family nonheme iron enzyme [Candidatus Venteria ishoeyi]MDM8545976.1 SUMF1/EgtB/PvdO family nonheme iron enzyme [Candidatus Venteria ishoeyi]